MADADTVTNRMVNIAKDVKKGDKNAIKEAAMRGLEYHIYGLEQQLLIANAAATPDLVLRFRR